ncbi:hypothetical protein, partial [Pantoea ananatis]|uniref:hypothetical protein n=1 Tax=Pantoea ananas TaxID=553 RepID=UPI0023509030
AVRELPRCALHFAALLPIIKISDKLTTVWKRAFFAYQSICEICANFFILCKRRYDAPSRQTGDAPRWKSRTILVLLSGGWSPFWCNFSIPVQSLHWKWVS